MRNDLTDKKALFRRDVELSRRSDVGEALLATSPSFVFIIWLLVAFASATVYFLFTYEYARRVKVPGRLIYEEGVARVYPQVDGIISKKFVAEGSQVKQGEPLFLISTDHQSTNAGSTAEGIIQQLNRRTGTFVQDAKRVSLLQTRDRASLKEKIEFLKREAAETKQEVESQESMVRINDNYLHMFKSLASQDYVSQAMLQEKQQANLDAHTKLYALLRDQSISERNLHDTQTALADFNDKAENESNALNREVSVLQQNVVENEAKREVVVYSKVAGTATAVLAEVGQSVTATQVLASVVPANVRMYVQFNVPTAAAGLIVPGQKVLLRYASFPYERFGQFKGTISSVPQTAMSSGELRINDETKDLFYPVRANIESQVVEMGNRRFPLREGMLVDADILLESRLLAEWLIEPALALKERYANVESKVR